MTRIGARKERMGRTADVHLVSQPCLLLMMMLADLVENRNPRQLFTARAAHISASLSVSQQKEERARERERNSI